MHKIKLSPEAERDLQDIERYIAQELGNPISAKQVLKRIITSVRRLADHPDSGPPLSSILENVETDFRFLVCGKYLAFYRHNLNTVYVIRVLYGKRNYISVLFPNLQQEQDDE